MSTTQGIWKMIHKNFYNSWVIFTAFLGVFAFSTLSAMAEGFKPTLDSLAGQPVAGSDPVEYYPQDLKSGYTVTEITNADPDNLPENAITVYEKDAETKKLTPKYYEVNLAETEYGNTNKYDSVSYYKFSIDSNGKKVLVTGTSTDFDIKYFVDNTRKGTTIRTNQSGAGINRDFIGLYTSSTGGAIYNYKSTIGDITGDFIGNYASSTSSSALGGAIYNFNATIGDITGDFIGNYATGSSANGGAIYNYYNATIGDITGDFIGNYAQSTGTSSYSFAKGGAICNDYKATIGDITGDFIGNYASSTSSYADGGAIYNYGASGKIGDITGDFIGNYAQSTGTSTSSSAYGGAIHNYKSTIGDITGDFIGNYASSTRYSASSGAIYNHSNATIGDITGDFIGNYVTAQSIAYGGAIYNYEGTIGDITGDFIGNYASSTGSYANGGAICNHKSTIGDITGDFIGNYASSTNNNAFSGAIYNSDGTIGNITGNFSGNYATAKSSAKGGAIYNSNSTIGDITGDFIGNYATAKSSAYGGAIYNDNSTIGNIKNSSFYNNYAKSENSTAQGGAIWTSKDITITADNGQSIFSGNYTESQGVKDDNAIWMDSSSAKLNLTAKNNGLIRFDDNINGAVGYDLNLNADGTSTIYFNNNIKNADININSDNIVVSSVDYLNNNNSLSINNANFALGNLGSNQLHFRNFSNTGNLVVNNVNVDLINKSMGRIYADSYGDTSGVIDVQKLTLLNDATNNSTSVLFADSAIADSVKYTGSSTVAYSPIYTYNVGYSKNPEDNLGYFVFTRGSNSGNPSDNFNPAVLPTAVAQQSGAYTTQMQTFNYAFQHADNFMNIPALDRLVIKHQNRYALSPTTDATDVGRLSPLFNKEHEHNGFWVKPYSSFESVPLKNGPKVSNINYGTLIGYDSNIKEIKYGWDRVLTGYVGYNGASQRYKGVDTYQNGGILGSTITLYKGNFFNATTLSVGASVGSTTSMFGHEDYTMLLSGIGNKTGYNFEFKDGKFIFQPSMLISYTFVNTFDYTNAAGVKINSDPLHAIQLAPGVKFIMNTKNGWQPYMAVNMVWNALDKQKVMANDVRLPEMSIKPYVEYGMGVQKCFKNDSLTAFGQAMVRNGGRNGVSLTAGLRFKVGKDLAKNNDVKSEKSKKTQKVKKEKVKKEKKICFPKIKFFAWSLSANN